MRCRLWPLTWSVLTAERSHRQLCTHYSSYDPVAGTRQLNHGRVGWKRKVQSSSPPNRSTQMQVKQGEGCAEKHMATKLTQKPMQLGHWGYDLCENSVPYGQSGMMDENLLQKGDIVKMKSSARTNTRHDATKTRPLPAGPTRRETHCQRSSN
jgi:hypothetical protein